MPDLVAPLSHPWHRRRAGRAARFRAVVICAIALVCVLGAGMLIRGQITMPQYRIAHLPGARAPGRAVPVARRHAEVHLASIPPGAPTLHSPTPSPAASTPESEPHALRSVAQTASR